MPNDANNKTSTDAQKPDERLSADTPTVRDIQRAAQQPDPDDDRSKAKPTPKRGT